MLVSFFVLSAVSPTRHATFRKAVTLHACILSALALSLIHQGKRGNPELMTHLLTCMGIVEGAILVGWRLTQLPKSQALEFLLVSPLNPSRVFLGEALVGLAMLTLVTLSGLPVLLVLVASGALDPFDLFPTLVIPLTWGAITGLGLTTWAYEPKVIRRFGEMALLVGVLFYLVVGVLAGENLRSWVDGLPATYQWLILSSVRDFHEHNPFGTIHAWYQNDLTDVLERFAWFSLASVSVVLLLLWRASRRLQGHFHERHYDPVRDVRDEKRPAVGNRPLAWWAVKRVTEYSGRVNVWLAGGFCLLYAIFMLAEQHWPSWMGRRIFQMCDTLGGAAALSAALVVLAAVPAAFQYGLWDSSAQDRCRRLELLLLTELQPIDYWQAALAAAIRRGRGYFVIALLLWISAYWSGRLTLQQLITAIATGTMVWSLYFALGFRAFARGAHSNGLGMLLTLGLPLGAWALARIGFPLVAAWLPPGMLYRAASGPFVLAWLVGPIVVTALTLYYARTSLTECDARLRLWYEQHHGSKVMS